jgi:hypothetical protein
MEDKMSNFNISISKLSIATLLGLGAFGFSGLAAHADTTSRLNQCRAFTLEKTARCCEEIVKISGKPMWMLDNHDSCKTAAMCVGKSSRRSKTRCQIQIRYDNNQGNAPKPSTKTRGRKD